MATLQKLLWTKEYSDFGEEVVLVESRFVLERKHGECLCMVHAGLTETIVLIAEEALDSEHLRTVVVSGEVETNVEYLHLAHLFPLENTKLSIRRHQEHRGEHVLRLRLSTGKTWYLELADGRHREDKWREWLSWIQDLDDRRHRKRQGMHLFQKSHQSTISQSSVEQVCADYEKGDGVKANATHTKTETTSRFSTINHQDSDALLAASRQQTRRVSRAYHWVGHFHGALSRDHDGTISPDDHDTSKTGLPGYSPDHPNQDHNKSQTAVKHKHGARSHSAAVMDPTLSLVWQHPSNHHPLPVRATSNSSTDTFSSLEDIESVGSLLGDANVDWSHPVSEEINRKLLLSVGELFQKFNIEAHGHGHVGRWRPMASMTAVDQLRDPAHTTYRRETADLPQIPGRETLQHRPSLPDVLEGEAAFLDDMHRAADAAHRESLAYMDLVNDDCNKTPHVIGGHVMLLSTEQTTLLEEIQRCREASPDLEFVIKTGSLEGAVVTSSRQGKVRTSDQQAAMHDKQLKKRKPHGKRRQSVGDSLKERLHLRRKIKHKKQTGQSDNIDHVHNEPITQLSTRILHSIRKHNEMKREEKVHDTRINSVHEIEPRLLAMELTLVESLLFVRVREAELVDCLWLKGDRSVRAPHTTRLIEFFDRVVGLVSTEILRQSTVSERSATVARLVAVAECCRVLQNFHGLKAVLSGMKVLPVYRLKKTWKAFEEDFPEEYSTWNELVCLMSDDGRSDLYRMAVRKSIGSPPCLPFFGTYLWSVADHYSAVDRGGMRCRSSRSSHSSSSSSSGDSESSEYEIKTVPDTGTSAPAPIPHRAGFFSTFASTWHTLRHRQDQPPQDGSVRPTASDSEASDTVGSSATGTKTMTYARKTHIRKLVVSYAKRMAEERGMVWRAGEAATAEDVLGAAFFAGVDNPLKWKDLFQTVKAVPSSKEPELEEDEDTKSAEFALYEKLFNYQMAAVQYKHTSNPLIRDYLLRADYNTEEQNFRLSLSREPPSD